MKKFRKRDNTASLTEELLNISEDDKETEEAIEPATNEELEEKTEDEKKKMEQEDLLLMENMLPSLKAEDELISFFGGFGNDSYDEWENEDEEPQIKQSIYYGYHEKEKKNKRLQLLINEEVLEDLRSEALSHDISVNELVNRLIKHFLYDNEWTTWTKKLENLQNELTEKEW